MVGMSDVTQILQKIASGEPQASEELLPLVYDELRKLAAARMVNERPDHTLSATALVHEAYVRLVDVDQAQNWDSRSHFFAAAAEAMRRILVDRARSVQRQKRGGELHRIDFQNVDPADVSNPDFLLALDEALESLTAEDPLLGSLVKLRYFAGLSLTDAAEAVGIGKTKAYKLWAYAKSRLWLLLEMPT